MSTPKSVKRRGPFVRGGFGRVSTSSNRSKDGCKGVDEMIINETPTRSIDFKNHRNILQKPTTDNYQVTCSKSATITRIYDPDREDFHTVRSKPATLVSSNPKCSTHSSKYYSFNVHPRTKGWCGKKRSV